MNLNFRTLRADEIDARVGTVSKDASGKPKGVTLLLYKDARVDMTLLDEVVGPMNWKREHSRDNANCTVSIWDDKKGLWVSKEDTGTESNTEKEKGLASDSFKRACFNWGIGRELYTAPFIYVGGDKAHLTRYVVTDIDYDDNRNICYLVVSDNKGNKVYSFGKKNTKMATKPIVKELAEQIGAEVTEATPLEVAKIAIDKATTIDELTAIYNSNKELLTGEQAKDFLAMMSAKKHSILNAKGGAA